MTNSDVARIINSDEVQRAIRPSKGRKVPFQIRKKNPLTNLNQRVKLNPFALTQKRRVALAKEKSTEERKKKVSQARKRNTKEFKKQLHAPSIAPVRGEAEISPF